MNKKISDLLEIKKGVTAFIGAGGKSTLIETIARELSVDSRVIICTTTRIYPVKGVSLVCPDNSDEILRHFSENENVVCIGGSLENEKLTTPVLKMDELIKLADYVLVEADGAKHLPLKAHAKHEPVIPDISNQTILVMGVDCIGKKISEVCHRPEICADLLNKDIDNIVSEKVAMELVRKEGFGDRIYINKVETEEDMDKAVNMTKETKRLMIAGSLWKNEYTYLE